MRLRPSFGILGSASDGCSAFCCNSPLVQQCGSDSSLAPLVKWAATCGADKFDREGTARSADDFQVTSVGGSVRKYRPEAHYMRGPGSNSREKYGPTRGRGLHPETGNFECYWDLARKSG